MAMRRVVPPGGAIYPRRNPPPDASGDSPMGNPSIDRAKKHLVKCSTCGEWEALQREVYAAHLEPVTASLDLSDDVIDRLPDESIGVLRVFILQDFFTARFGEQGERNVIDAYLRRRGWCESVPARRYLKALRDSTVSLSVVDIVPGRSVTVRDLIQGGEPVRGENDSEAVSPEHPFDARGKISRSTLPDLDWSGFETLRRSSEALADAPM